VKFTVFDSRTAGLPGDVIVSLFADGAGGLWVGTEKGPLARYAMGKFTTFAHPEGWREVRGTCFAEEGDRLLIGTHRGGVIEYKDGRFARLLADAGAEALSRMQFAGPMNLGGFPGGRRHLGANV
jgi:ligand-binding sensor domain-containing protein